MSGSSKPEIVGFPPKGRCKVVQLYLDGSTPCIAFGANINNDIHGFILSRFLSQRKIPFETVKGNASCMEIPVPQGERYRLVGAGGAIPESEQSIMIYGNSQDYGIEIDRSHLDKVAEAGLIPEGWELIYFPPRP